MHAIIKAPNRLRGDERTELERLRKKTRITCARPDEQKQQREVRRQKARLWR